MIGVVPIGVLPIGTAPSVFDGSYCVEAVGVFIPGVITIGHFLPGAVKMGEFIAGVVIHDSC